MSTMRLLLEDGVAVAQITIRLIVVNFGYH